MKNLILRKFTAILAFTWRNYKRESIAALVFSIAAFLWVFFTNSENPFSVMKMDSWYADWLDPIVTVGTFLLAFFVWWDSKGNEWKNKLPKRLTVHFMDEDRYVLSCFNSKLVGEQDIRNFSQQIGFQMNGKAHLDFIPGITEIESGNPILTDNSGYISYYEVVVHLTSIPEKFKNKYVSWQFLNKANFENLNQKLKTKTDSGIKLIEKHKQQIKTTNGHPTNPHPFNPKTDA